MQAAFPGENGQIAFHDFDGEDLEIVVINPDGTGVTQLMDNQVSDLWPAWSPDGEQIAFLREPDVYVMNADGSNPVNLTPSQEPVFSDPAWSTDGTPPSTRPSSPLQR